MKILLITLISFTLVLAFVHVNKAAEATEKTEDGSPEDQVAEDDVESLEDGEDVEKRWMARLIRSPEEKKWMARLIRTPEEKKWMARLIRTPEEKKWMARLIRTPEEKKWMARLIRAPEKRWMARLIRRSAAQTGFFGARVMKRSTGAVGVTPPTVSAVAAAGERSGHK